jgi:hypothetical protein
VVIRLGWGDITPKHACNLRIHRRASPWFPANADKIASQFYKMCYIYVFVKKRYFDTCTGFYSAKRGIRREP